MQTVPRIESLTPAAHERRAFFSYSGPMAGDSPALPAPRPGLLALEGGIVQHGTIRGADVAAEGDLIFTTAATGWGEVLTDPSYAGQVVVLTHPMAGNYRIGADELESAKVHARALVVSRLVTPPAGRGWSLEELLVAGGIPVITGIDTRALTLELRRGAARRLSKRRSAGRHVHRRGLVEPDVGIRRPLHRGGDHRDHVRARDQSQA